MPHSDDSKFLLILEKLSDIGERSARMEVEQRNMKEDLEAVKKQDEVQNQLLSEHIRGVETQAARLDNEILVRRSLEQQAADLKSRVDKLEEPSKLLATAKKYLLYISATGGAIVAILKWLERL